MKKNRPAKSPLVGEKIHNLPFDVSVKTHVRISEYRYSHRVAAKGNRVVVMKEQLEGHNSKYGNAFYKKFEYKCWKPLDEILKSYGCLSMGSDFWFNVNWVEKDYYGNSMFNKAILHACFGSDIGIPLILRHGQETICHPEKIRKQAFSYLKDDPNCKAIVSGMIYRGDLFVRRATKEITVRKSNPHFTAPLSRSRLWKKRANQVHCLRCHAVVHPTEEFKFLFDTMQIKL